MRGWSVLGVAFVACVFASPSAAFAADAVLPLTRVRLYETGIGYFERTGRVSPEGATLRLPAGHLDDALKTLVVMNAKVRVGGITFASSLSRDMAKKLGGWPEAGDVPLGLSELSRSFKGAGVALTTKQGLLRGRLVEVLEPGQGELERCTRELGASAAEAPNKGSAPSAPGTCQLVERASLLLLTEQGELRRIPTAEVLALRPTEPGARARLETALDALSQRGAQTRRELRVLSPASGDVTLGYVAEAPVWRATYRVVLGPPHARLQGWALLHNDTDEDWRRVQVELVNGRPDAFLYPLAVPRYARRELVTPPEPLHSVPQLFDTTVDDMWNGEEVSGGGGGQGVGLGGLGTMGFGAGAGAPASKDTTSSSELELGNLAALVPAVGIEAAALFRYILPQAISLNAHGSALVPLLDSKIEVRRVSWFGVGATTAASAMYVTNSTQQTLPAGTIAVLEAGGFAGESMLPRMKPREARLLTYGVDLDVELKREPATGQGAATEESRLFSFAKGQLVQHFLRRRGESLELKNRSAAGRTVYVALDVIDNARITGAAELGREAVSAQTYTVLQVAAREAVTQKLELEEGLQRTHSFAKLDSRQLYGFSLFKTIPPRQRAILARAAEHLAAVERRLGARPKRQSELEQALADVTRIRENARVLGGVRADQVDDMAERIVRLERQIAELRTRIAELSTEAVGFKASAERELEGL